MYKLLMVLILITSLIGCDSFKSNPLEPEEPEVVVEKYKMGEYNIRVRFNLNGNTQEAISNGNHIVTFDDCYDFDLNIGYTNYRDNNTGMIWADGIVRLVPTSRYIYEDKFGEGRAPITGYEKSITLHEFIPPYSQQTKKYNIYYITKDNLNYAQAVVSSKFYIITSSQSVTKAEVSVNIKWKVNMEGGRDF